MNTAPARSPFSAAVRACAIASAAWSLLRCLSTSRDITTCLAISGLSTFTSSLSNVDVS
ncbi:hypothetical protein MtrunA17_Chr1g0199611 [Medicago truncatula]|uniref:Uncharacterized protein n=1 Tax=Medicago truncatula TaxID=3880 RepID=A0A396JZ72_MEDTR|nr:hypothetical protein MtrunA17_Chr1g0199611 [Medicago truncatula]